MNIKLSFLGLLSMSSAYAVWQPYMETTSVDVPGKTVSVLAPFGQHHVATQAFDANHNEVELDTMLFGKELTIGDVYLQSKLAKEAKLQSTAANPTDTLGWLATLSDAKIDIESVQKCFRFGFNGSLTLPKNSNDGVKVILGFSLPFEYYEHHLDVDFPDAELGADSGTGSSDYDVFFANYGTVESFFYRDVIGLKGLVFKEFQRSLGVGATELFGLLDLSNYAHEKIEKMQIGVILGLPTGSEPDSSVVWPIERGSSGAWQLGAISNITWFRNGFFNPFVSCRVLGSFANTISQRVPRKYTFAAGQTMAQTRIIHRSATTTGTSIGMALNTAIDRYETDVPFFADTAIPVERTLGAIFDVKFGNSINYYDKLILNTWYYFHQRLGDTIKVASWAPVGVYNIDVVSARTNQRTHSFGWCVAYPFGIDKLFSIGSQHAIAGKNSPRYHSLFIAFQASF